jgi:hypothetical protein
MARKKSPPKRTKHHFIVRSLTLTPATESTLRQLSEDASDELGWSVSKSALTRAMILYVKQQGASWAKDNLFSLIEKELEGGIIWGNRRK